MQFHITAVQGNAGDLIKRDVDFGRTFCTAPSPLIRVCSPMLPNVVIILGMSHVSHG